MEIQLNTANGIRTGEALEAAVRQELEHTLGRFAGRLTRIEVHLSDQNSPAKGGADDIRCTLEARPEGLRPVAVSHDAARIAEALRGAAQKLARALEAEFGKLDRRR
ncbi:MAG: HPF/RaiA family ribosome-associated protein [Rhodobacteraceae bacterium]|nr:HPF/RaiA family ribosome-associated protein [Paracoccaceae bacterium]